MLKSPLTRWVAVLSLALCAPAFAQPKKEVTFAHQDMLVPLRIVQESGELEKATGYKINWRMFMTLTSRPATPSSLSAAINW